MLPVPQSLEIEIARNVKYRNLTCEKNSEKLRSYRRLVGSCGFGFPKVP
jgi:hypothetical protein